MWNGDSLIAENGLHPHSRCSNKSALHTLPGKSHLLLLLAPQFLSPVYTSALSSTPGYSATYWASRPEWLTGNSYSVRSKLSLLPNPAPLYLLDSPHSHPSQNLSSYLFFSFFFLSFFSTSSWFQTSIDSTYWYLSNISFPLHPHCHHLGLDISGPEFLISVLVSSSHFHPFVMEVIFKAHWTVSQS